MSFEFASAKALYARNLHPRLLVGPDDLPLLRRRIKTGDARTIMEGMRHKVRPRIRAILEHPDLLGEMGGDKARQRGQQGDFMNCLLDVAMVGTLDDDVDALEAALRIVRALPAMPASGLVYYMCCGLHPAAYDLLYHRLTPEERLAYGAHIVASVKEVMTKGMAGGFFRCAGGNFPISLSVPGLLGLLAVRGDPGVPDVTDLLTDNIRMLQASLNTGLRADGYPEEDMGYGTLMASRLAMMCEPLRRSGLFDPYAACPRFGRIGEAMLHFVQPWGRHLSTTGDHGDDFSGRDWVLAPEALEHGKPELLWLLGTLSYGELINPAKPEAVSHVAEIALRKDVQVPAGSCALLFADQFKRAAHPSSSRPLGESGLRRTRPSSLKLRRTCPSRRRVPTAFCDRERGLVTFRSGWKPDDTFVVFDGSQRSPSAQGHMHASAGHFCLSALGEYFAIGPGRYNMEQNCQNIVLVDGQSGRSTDGQWSMTFWHGLLTEYRPGRFCDTAAVDSSHQHNCYWARRYIGLVKDAGSVPAYLWTVEDINKANDWAEFWWQLHTSPENTIALHATHAEITGWRYGNKLAIHFALPAPESYPRPHTLTLAQDIAESSSYKYIPNSAERVKKFARPSDMLHYSAFQRPRLLAKVGGYNGRFMSVLLPRCKDAVPARVTRLPSLDNSLAVRIDFGDVRDTLIFAYEHHLLEADGISGRGQWCVVRRAARTGRVLAAELHDGTRLTVDGKNALKNCP